MNRWKENEAPSDSNERDYEQGCCGGSHKSKGKGSNWKGAKLKGSGASPWNPCSIVAMVLGFILFWPIGLALLFWMISGRPVSAIPGAARETWASMFGSGNSSGWASRSTAQSGNQVFDEYQQTQHDRIAEIKTEIRDTYDRFRDFKNDAKRKAEKEEFDNFMNSSRPTTQPE